MGTNMKNTNRRWLKLGNQGQGLTEYLVLMVLVALFCVGTVGQVGKAIKSKLVVARNHIMKVSVEGVE
jgi:Flp pilus assembly pilin Flp